MYIPSRLLFESSFRQHMSNSSETVFSKLILVSRLECVPSYTILYIEDGKKTDLLENEYAFPSKLGQPISKGNETAKAEISRRLITDFHPNCR